MAEQKDYLKATTLTACVDGIGPSMAGIGPHYKIAKFRLGHVPSLLDEANKTVQALPLDTNVTEGEFFSADLEPTDFQWSNGQLLVRCICPEDALLEPFQFSVLYLEDNLGNLSHGVVKLPDTILPETGAEIWVYVEFPINVLVQ